jgi:type I restriction enzyme R subunit
VKRREAKKADYIRYIKPSLPIVFEAKDNNYAVDDGMQQALEYAEIFDKPDATTPGG